MSIQLNKLAVEDLEILLDVYRDNSKKTNEIKKIMKQKDIENGGLRYDKNTNRIYNLKFEAINKKESNKIKKSETAIKNIGKAIHRPSKRFLFNIPKIAKFIPARDSSC